MGVPLTSARASAELPPPLPSPIVGAVEEVSTKDEQEEPCSSPPGRPSEPNSSTDPVALPRGESLPVAAAAAATMDDRRGVLGPLPLPGSLPGGGGGGEVGARAHERSSKSHG